ncbi:hypothetical protein PR202_ga10316 [Eleusine coracana subsp. coracana]|uniref:Uncharacterized protein n=1 Tax=Eleusine coracana subsp. coracana TaxID=191504 RepID=A0AAV5C6E0_ELECO|nr:hypothetical protein PR202_ga10316 [Eleusine coracana subsp. coracana]
MPWIGYERHPLCCRASAGNRTGHRCCLGAEDSDAVAATASRSSSPSLVWNIQEQRDMAAIDRSWLPWPSLLLLCCYSVSVRPGD